MTAMFYEHLIRAAYQCSRGHDNGAEASIYRAYTRSLSGSDEYERDICRTRVKSNIDNALLYLSEQPITTELKDKLQQHRNAIYKAQDSEIQVEIKHALETLKKYGFEAR